MDMLVVGAGPTGLSVALFCAARGVDVRVVERATERAPFSKAFGVNARTLEVLEDVGVTERFLANGRRMPAVNLWVGTRHVVKNALEGLHPRFDFMLIQSQADSERILAEALLERGVTVETGTALSSLSLERADSVEVTLTSADGEASVTAPLVFGADGPRSAVRAAAGIAFEGAPAAEPWRLYDVEIDETELERDEAHAVMLDSGALFMVRIQGEVWRVLGNVPDLLERLPGRSRPGAVHWESDFGLAHKIASSFSAGGRVFLGGDAAHIHSGLGARGMNLGIEDAAVFASRLERSALAGYDDARRSAVVPVMKKIARMTDVMRGRSVPARLARHVVPHLAPRVQPKILPALGRFVLGVDHPLDAG